MNFFMPVRIYTGNGIISLHADDLKAFGHRCLIVTGRNAAKKSGALDDMTSALDHIGTSWIIFDKIGPNPDISACMEAGRIANGFDADYIIGIGGGSPMDAAKAAAVFAANPFIDEEQFYGKDWKNPPRPIILVGTTSGTGSEVTGVAVLTDSRSRKHSIHDERLYAAISFGDARYTETLSRDVTLSTGIDVLAHCTESYFSRKATAISRAFSLKGISMLFEPLLAASSGNSLTSCQRETMYDASILGGMAICVTGTAFPHNVGYYLTEKYNVPHGIACAVFLPDMLKLVSEYDREYALKFYSATGISESVFLELISKSLPDMKISMSNDEISDILPRWEDNGSVKNTRGNIGVENIKSILTAKFSKKMTGG